MARTNKNNPTRIMDSMTAVLVVLLVISCTMLPCYSLQVGFCYPSPNCELEECRAQCSPEKVPYCHQEDPKQCCCYDPGFAPPRPNNNNM
ncbi:hypothetical protein ACP4OV_002084 [Aristida adscensionis]